MYTKHNPLVGGFVALFVSLLVLGLFPVRALAQDSIVRYERSSHVMLKPAPLWLVDQDPAVALGAEIRTSLRTSVQGELGYGWPGWGQLAGTDRHTGTWRMKAEWRFYRNRYNPDRSLRADGATTYPLGKYQAVEVYIKLLSVSHNWTYHDPITNPYPFRLAGELRQTRFWRNSLSLTYKVGWQFGWTNTVPQGWARFVGDVYIGLGVRVTNQDNGENWAVPTYRESFRAVSHRFRSDGISVAPNLSLGVKLGFGL